MPRILESLSYSMIFSRFERHWLEGVRLLHAQEQRVEKAAQGYLALQ